MTSLKALILSDSCWKCICSNDEIFKKEESIEISKIIGLIDDINDENILP